MLAGARTWLVSGAVILGLLCNACRKEAQEPSRTSTHDAPAATQPAALPTTKEVLDRITILGGHYFPGPSGIAKPEWQILLSGTDATDADIRVISALPNIVAIKLGNTKVTDEGVAWLTTQKRLERVGLRNTAVTGEGVRRLFEGLPGLQEVNLMGTAVKPADLVAVRGIPDAPSVSIRPFKWDDVDRVALGELKPTEWVDSEDEMLSLRMFGPSKKLPLNYPIVVFAQLRNNTSDLLAVLEPFDGRRVNPPPEELLSIVGPRGQVGCWRLEFSSESGSPFVAIAPGPAWRAPLELHVWMCSDTNEPGDYTITYTYCVPEEYGNIGKPPPDAATIWTGQIVAEPVTVTKE